MKHPFATSPNGSSAISKWIPRCIIGVVFGAALTGCLAADLAPTATATEPPPTPSPTVEFPTLVPTPTEGRTLPTAEAPEPLAGAGDILYQTEFDSAGQWPLGQDSLGTVSLSGEALALVLPGPSLGRLIPSPAPLASSFILDVVLQAEVCQGTDEFGLAFLLSAEGDHMRFTITCEGGYRIRRVLGSDRRAWVPFTEREPAVLPGAPAENRLTVRSQGSQFRLYINGFQVHAGSEPSLNGGGAGLVAASSADSSQMTVLFKSFTLYELQAPAGTESTDG